MSKQEWTGERLETTIWGETTAEHLHRYAIALELVKNKNVLDLACGEGYGSHLLSKKAASVTGIDIDNSTIDKASKKYTASNLKFLAGSATSIPLQESLMDVIVSFETIEHLSGHDEMMKECKRVLKPGGLLIISTPNKKKYSGEGKTKNPFHQKELDQEEFDGLLKKYFINTSTWWQHSFVSSLITDEYVQVFSGDYSAIEKDTTPQPLYFFALASDQELPARILPSLFDPTIIINKALEEKEKSIRSSASYRTGHFLLSPFKFFRRLFAGKKRNE